MNLNHIIINININAKKSTMRNILKLPWLTKNEEYSNCRILRVNGIMNQKYAIFMRYYDNIKCCNIKFDDINVNNEIKSLPNVKKLSNIDYNARLGV